jgi:hypothetical protein
MNFDSFRRSLEDLINRATPPEDRHTIAARMRDTLVQAKMGLEDMRAGLTKSRERLALEERELETVRRRKQLAEGIGDRETADIALKYEEMHSERVAIVRKKVDAQEGELSLAERDVETMTAELKAAMRGAPMPPAASVEAGDPADAAEPDAGALRNEIDSLARSRARAAREADADRQLEELKRRMGK